MRRAIMADLVDQKLEASAWAAGAQWYGPGGIGRATSRAEYAVLRSDAEHSLSAPVARGSREEAIAPLGHARVRGQLLRRALYTRGEASGPLAWRAADGSVHVTSVRHACAAG